MQRALGKVELQLAHVYLVGLRHSSRPPLRHSDAVRTSQRNEEARGEKTRSTTKKLLLLWTEERRAERRGRGGGIEQSHVLFPAFPYVALGEPWLAIAGPCVSIAWCTLCPSISSV
ncbi:unnamed protein product [Prorocentrum cordatum]|uniref:Uncharacterized protein n=1 Tax=Prorocentrum cordatum TaxID=2364126 RepID=A0ABN9W9C2_9DINO|nr:unnamed protein product [Polarella glacialis]